MAAAIAMKLNKVTSNACRQQHVAIIRNNLGEQNVQVANDRLTEFGITVDVPKWEDTSHFNLSWLSLIERHQKDVFPKKIKKAKSLRTWLQYDFNPENPTKSTMGCRLSRKYFDAFQLSISPRLAKSTSLGVLKTDKIQNTNEWNKHLKSKQQEVKQEEVQQEKTHTTVLSQLQQAHENELPRYFDAVNKKLEASENHILEATSKMLRTVYTEIIANVPFYQHPKIVELQKINGVPLGYHHYDPHGATRMMELILREMHARLLQKIKSNNDPISIILDGSTSTDMFHFLSVLVQTLENERPIVYLYRLVELGVDETAVGLKNALIQVFQKDGIESHMKEKLVGFGSDGAAVNTGNISGLVCRPEIV